VIGVLQLINRRIDGTPGSFSADDQTFVEALAGGGDRVREGATDRPL